jgi:hypothetical protein
MRESPNIRPGEPLRSWLARTDVVEFDAILIVRMAGAADALMRVIDGGQLSDKDVIALGRLNAHSVHRWYEPPVCLMDGAQILPQIADFFKPLLSRPRKSK